MHFLGDGEHVFSFNLRFSNFVVLASHGGLYVFRSHILLAPPGNKILAVYAPQGLGVTCDYLEVLHFGVLSVSHDAYTFWPSNVGFLETEQHWKDFVAGVWG